MGGRGRWVLLSVGVAVVAFAVRLAMVLRGAGLGGLFGYDDGVYFSAATSLAWGRLPYRDFVLLHPPGIVWALLPFAGLARLTSDALGFEAARVAFMAIGALNAALVVAATRRLGLVPAAAAGLFYAVWNPGAGAETTTRLEPLLNLGLLAAIALLVDPARARSRRVQALAGAALGLALATKIWAAVPVLVVLLWCWWGRPEGARPARRVAVSAATTTAALCLPFWLLAPRSMTRMVVLDQLGRPRSMVSLADRVVAILGAPRPGDPTVANPAALATAGWSLGAWVAAVTLLVVAALAVAGRGSDHLGRWVVGLLAAQVGVLLASPPFFGFYPAYVAPAMALTVGAGVAGAGELVRRTARARVAHVPRVARVGGVAVLGVALVPLVAVDAAGRVGVPLPAAQLRPLAATARCITADRPDLLILLDALGRDLRRGCPVLVDVTGLTYDTERGASTSHVQRRHNEAWQHTLRAYLLSGGTALLGRPGGDGLSARTLQVLRGLPVLEQGEGYRLYAVPASRRRPAPEVPADREPGLMALLAP